MLMYHNVDHTSNSTYLREHKRKKKKKSLFLFQKCLETYISKKVSSFQHEEPQFSAECQKQASRSVQLLEWPMSCWASPSSLNKAIADGEKTMIKHVSYFKRG